ncbi:MAG: serine hydrolase domain-containing protein [Polyangiaceae bacterium]
MSLRPLALGFVISLVFDLSACAGPPAPKPALPPPPPAPAATALPSAPPPPSAPPATRLDDATRATLAEHLDQLATLGTGASLAASIDGQIVSLVTGTQLADGPAVRSTTRFNVASVSKLLTAAKVVHLAHQKELALTDPVATRLSGVRFLDAGGHDLAATITLDQLLMHRGGLPHFDPAFDPASFGSSWQDPELLTKMGRGWTLTLKAAPGTYGYSNLSYATLAAVIEATEDCSFADCMAAFLSETLDLKSATMWPANLDGDAAHGRTVKDGETTFLPPAWYGSRLAIPYSGLWISMPDLAKFGARLVTAQRDPQSALHAMTTGVPNGEKGHGRGLGHTPRGAVATLGPAG